ncbi:MAG TPA: hypothetical protein VGV92_02920 [Gammaproteobacteria bacterium]|nr:hypothetical protein [Gammaproteobacteria bacterium]
MDANETERVIPVKPTDFGDVAEAILNRNAVQLKKVLEGYRGENGGDVQGLVDLCDIQNETPSELKILLMARLMTLSQTKEHLKLLNDDFNYSDIKKVLRQLDVKTRQKLNEATKDTSYRNIKSALKKFPKQNEEVFSPAAAVATLVSPAHPNPQKAKLPIFRPSNGFRHPASGF